ncbi:MAG: quinol:cytochrome C oxidoreductase [Acidobacteriota bacterium]
MSKKEVRVDENLVRIPDGHVLKRWPAGLLIVSAVLLAIAVASQSIDATSIELAGHGGHGSDHGEHHDDGHGKDHGDGHGGDHGAGHDDGHGDGHHGGHKSSLAPVVFSFLTACCYFLSLSVGGIFFVLVQHCAKAGWSVVVRRIAENVGTLVFWFIIPFTLLWLFGAHDLFHWTHADAMATDVVLQWKAPYLNSTFFIVRGILAWLVLWWIARINHRDSVEQDLHGSHETSRQLQYWSGFRILLFAFAVTFFAFDWIMSLDAHWFSTMFGVYYFAGSVLGFFAFMTLVVLLLQGAGLLGELITIEHYHDLGKYCFAFTVFWGYIAFSQFMLIWYGNLPEETLWFEHRMNGPWAAVARVLLVCHFLIPFFALMAKTVKKIGFTLGLGAIWLLVVHYVDLYWLIMPNLYVDHWPMKQGIVDLLCFLAAGAAFTALFLRVLTRHALIPLRDPRLQESLAFENF